MNNSHQEKSVIYLLQVHERDNALTIRESCANYFNNAWICRRHGCIDFKQEGVRGTTRYLKGEIEALGFILKNEANWKACKHGTTCCMGGTGYEGRLRFDSVAEAVKFLKRFFRVLACERNTKETQEWIDKL